MTQGKGEKEPLLEFPAGKEDSAEVKPTLRSAASGRSRSHRRRGLLWQKPRREAERQLRREALRYQRFRILQGGKAKDVAVELRRSRRTLCEWARKEARNGLEARARGRLPRRSSREERNRVIAALELFGPGIGRSAFRTLWPEMARGEVDDLVTRYRCLYRREHALPIRSFTWLRPGAVWAMDHANPPGAVDGIYPALFSLRDLSSGKALLWQALEDMSAEATIRALEEARREHGIPLVVKSDNGPAFISDAMKDYFQSLGIIPLLSPPGRPQYNGSCEAAIGWMKQRTRYQAARAGRVGPWSSEDLEMATILSNETPRARSPGHQSPQEIWKARTPIDGTERESFRAAVDGQRSALRAEAGGSITEEEESNLERQAITRALVAHGILNIRRRVIPLPYKFIFRAKIS